MLHKIKNGSSVENLRILSLDGGGIRGVAVSRILQEVETHFQKPIHELFDLVIGTSTGGLLSLMLTVPNKEGTVMSAQAAKELYVKKGKDIFRGSRWNIVGVKYLQEGLCEMVTELFDDETTLKHAKTHVGVVCTDEMHGKSIVMNSFRATKYHDDYRHNAKLVEIAKATTAAPTYFEHVMLEEVAKDYIEPRHDETKEWFVIDSENDKLDESIEWYTMEEPIYRRKKILLEDGGTSNNNPSHLGLKLVKHYLKHHGIKAKNIQLVSLGTGNIAGSEVDPEEASDFWSNIGSNTYSVVQRVLIHDPFRVATKAYEVHRKVLSKFREKKQLHNYIRVQFKIDNHQFMNMDDVTEKNINSLLQSAEGYIYGEDAEEKIYSENFKKLLEIIEGSNKIRETQIIQQTIDADEKTVEVTEEHKTRTGKDLPSPGRFASAFNYVTSPVKLLFGGGKQVA